MTKYNLNNDEVKIVKFISYIDTYQRTLSANTAYNYFDVVNVAAIGSDTILVTITTDIYLVSIQAISIFIFETASYTYTTGVGNPVNSFTNNFGVDTSQYG